MQDRKGDGKRQQRMSEPFEHVIQVQCHTRTIPILRSAVMFPLGMVRFGRGKAADVSAGVRLVTVGQVLALPKGGLCHCLFLNRLVDC